MTIHDYQLEKFLTQAAARPADKDSDTITRFDRDIFWYDRTEVDRQLGMKPSGNKITYEDHRRAVETAVNLLHADSSHDITMAILNHRFFAQYRADVLQGLGSFAKDYPFILKKVSMLYSPKHGKLNSGRIPAALKEFTTPTLVQLNHIAGEVTKVTVPENGLTLNEWAQRFNINAPESTTYMVAGLKVGI